ncbi:hypothetical protein BOQ63_001195 (plasmid) [Streptomyces viridifaciens]|nr:hypothetical protein BOQ63_001195 [Streptomyces viridifaciens]
MSCPVAVSWSTAGPPEESNSGGIPRGTEGPGVRLGHDPGGRGQRLDVEDDRQYGRRFCEQIADRPAACVDPFRHRQVGGDPVILLRLAGILLQGDNLSLDPADDPVEHLAVDVQEAAAWAAAYLRPGGPVSNW